MTINNKIVAGLIFILLAVLVSLKFNKYVFKKDYFLYMHIPCPQGVSCFEYGGSKYVKLYRKAFEVERCYNNESCNPLACEQGEKDCAYVYCSEVTIEEDEVCT
jgi:hypothetical protein